MSPLHVTKHNNNAVDNLAAANYITNYNIQNYDFFELILRIPIFL